MTVAPIQTEVPLKGYVGEIIQRLGDLVIEVQQCQERRGIVRIDPKRTVESAEAMFAMEDSRLATATGLDVRDGIDILYHWCFEPAGVVVTLKALDNRLHRIRRAVSARELSPQLELSVFPSRQQFECAAPDLLEERCLLRQA